MSRSLGLRNCSLARFMTYVCVVWSTICPFRGHAMAQEQLPQAPQFEATTYNPSADPSPKSSSLLLGAIKFCSIAVVTMVVSTAAIWWVNRKPNSNASADAFLWFAGQNKTWNEYQKSKKDAGYGRLDEKEYDWMQQL